MCRGGKDNVRFRQGTEAAKGFRGRYMALRTNRIVLLGPRDQGHGVSVTSELVFLRRMGEVSKAEAAHDDTELHGGERCDGACVGRGYENFSEQKSRLSMTERRSGAKLVNR